MRQEPSTDMLMFQAVLAWIVAWWLIDIAQGHPMTIGVGTLFASCAMGLAIASVTQSVPQPSPFASSPGRVLWALRPRKWMIAWGVIVGLLAVLGRPMILNWYGGGRCQYIDWWVVARWLPAHGDGLFGGCRFLVGW